MARSRTMPPAAPGFGVPWRAARQLGGVAVATLALSLAILGPFHAHAAQSPGPPPPRPSPPSPSLSPPSPPPPNPSPPSPPPQPPQPPWPPSGGGDIAAGLVAKYLAATFNAATGIWPSSSNASNAAVVSGPASLASDSSFATYVAGACPSSWKRMKTHTRTPAEPRSESPAHGARQVVPALASASLSICPTRGSLSAPRQPTLLAPSAASCRVAATLLLALPLAPGCTAT